MNEAPKKARMQFDEHGSYLIFRTVCEDCQVQLTSRNQWRDRNLCFDHGKARDTERLRLANEQRTKERRLARATDSDILTEQLAAPAANRKTRRRSVEVERDPVKADLRERLEAFMHHADNEAIFGRLQEGIKSFELSYRLKRVLPPETVYRTIGLTKAQPPVTLVTSATPVASIQTNVATAA